MSENLIKEVTSDEVSDYMYNTIARIIKEAGPRAPCSEAEKKAAGIVEEELKKTCDETRQEEFTCYPKAFLGWIRLDVGLMLIAFALFIFLSPLQPLVISIIGIVCVGLAFLFLFKQFFKYEEFTPKFLPYKKKTSQNIVGIIKPTGEVKKRVCFGGHLDSAYRFNLIHYFGAGYALFFAGGIFALVESAIIFVLQIIFSIFGSVSPYTIAICGILVVTLPVILSMALLFMCGDRKLLFGALRNATRRSKAVIIAVGTYSVAVFAVLVTLVFDAVTLVNLTILLFVINIPTLIALFFFASSKATPGAIDNLTACAPAMAVAKVLHDWKTAHPDWLPKNTEVVVSIVGCEEVGLRGSEAFARAHAEDYNKIDTTVVNMESISDSQCVQIYTRENTTATDLTPEVYELLETCAKELGINYEMAQMPAIAGGTDAAGFVRGGLKASSLCGLNHMDYLQYYHTDRDNLDIINKERLPWDYHYEDHTDYNVRGAMEKALCICLRYLQMKDAQ